METLPMSIFQVIASLFALFMIYTVTLYYKKKTLSSFESSFWIALWGLFVVISIFPDLLMGISNTLKFSRVFDLLLVAALMILSVITFINYFTHKKLESRIEKIVREDALHKK